MNQKRLRSKRSVSRGQFKDSYGQHIEIDPNAAVEVDHRPDGRRGVRLASKEGQMSYLDTCLKDMQATTQKLLYKDGSAESGGDH